MTRAAVAFPPQETVAFGDHYVRTCGRGPKRRANAGRPSAYHEHVGFRCYLRIARRKLDNGGLWRPA